MYTMSKTCEKRLSPHQYAKLIVEPAEDANKYSRGRLLVVAGSEQYPGAAILTSLAATRSGAGYVTLAAPKSIVPIAQANLLTAPVVGLPTDDRGGLALRASTDLLELMDRADALVIGPGLGSSAQSAELVRYLVKQSQLPLVLDADGLNAFVGHAEKLQRTTVPLILTPHEGELKRLGTIEALASERCIVVAKGPATIISNGTEAVRDDTGPSSLASAGTGDVLAGTIGALLCQGLDALSAALLGVRIHSTAAILATEALTSCCMMATDVIEYIPHAVRRIKESA